jgi:hypothetical protein
MAIYDDRLIMFSGFIQRFLIDLCVINFVISLYLVLLIVFVLVSIKFFL